MVSIQSTIKLTGAVVLVASIVLTLFTALAASQFPAVLATVSWNG